MIDREREEREQVRPPRPEPAPSSEVARLPLPLAAGNKAVGRMLARLKRAGPDANRFAYASYTAATSPGLRAP